MMATIMYTMLISAAACIAAEIVVRIHNWRVDHESETKRHHL